MDKKPKITINDFNSICRLCLNKNRRLKKLFKTQSNRAQAEDQSLHQMINICFGLNISADDGLPLQLCNSCSNKLVGYHSFRIQSIASDDFLRILKFKEDRENDYGNDNDDWNDYHTDDEEQIDKKQNDFIPVSPVKLQFSNQIENFSKIAPEDIKPIIKIEDDETTMVVEPTEMMRPKMLIEENKKNNETATVSSAKIKTKTKQRTGRPKKLTDEERKQRLKLVRRKVHEANAGICQICGIYYKSLSNHIRMHEIKSMNASVQCDYCNQTISNKIYLRAHFKKHFKTRSHQCPLCSYKFLTSAPLKRHMMTHTGEKPHMCEICSKTFRQLTSLKEHKRSHFKSYDVPCPYCDKMFLSKNNLRSHIGIHTGERPYKCDACDAAFVASSSLAIHRKKHKQDNPLVNQCKICHIVYENRSILRNHLRVTHGIDSNYESMTYTPITF